MRTHWICRLFGHRYKNRAIIELDARTWIFAPVCQRCGDRPEY